MSNATCSRTSRSVLVAAGIVAIAQLASADIIGLPIPGWQVNRWDAASASPVDPPSSITLTTNTSGQSRSMFHVTKQSVAKFQASFTYRFTGTASSTMGAAFVLHNESGGATAVSAASVSGVPTQLGYFDSDGTFKGKSLAVTLQAGYLGAGSSSTGVYTGGSVGGGSTSTGPVNFFSGHAIRVVISYDGALLSMKATDLITGLVFNGPKSAINISSFVGGSSAFVGFTGSTNSNSGTTQTISDFSYLVPSPGTTALLLPLAFGIRRRR